MKYFLKINLMRQHLQYFKLKINSYKHKNNIDSKQPNL